MADIAPAPTYADPIQEDPVTHKAVFNPVWLSWFLLVSQFINTSGGASGTAHNNLSGLQGGSSTERYHLTGAAATAVEANYSTWLSSTSPFPASKVQGRTDGAAPSAGYIGQTITGTATGTLTFNSATILTSVSLTAGSWDITGQLYFPAPASALTNVACELTTGSSLDSGQTSQLASNAQATGINAARIRLDLATTTTVNLVGEIVGTSSGSASHTSKIIAVRTA